MGKIPTLFTSGDIAALLGVKRDKITYLLRSDVIRPIGEAGRVRLYDAKVVRGIAQRLAEMTFLFTSGNVASSLGIKPADVNHVVRTRNIAPVQRAGLTRFYDRDGVKQIVQAVAGVKGADYFREHVVRLRAAKQRVGQWLSKRAAKIKSGLEGARANVRFEEENLSKSEEALVEAQAALARAREEYGQNKAGLKRCREALAKERYREKKLELAERKKAKLEAILSALEGG